MEEIKRIKGRFQNKTKTEDQWVLDVYTDSTKTTLREDPFIPLNGELVIFEAKNEEEEVRFKFGNGIKNVMDLPFASSKAYEGDGEDSLAVGENSKAITKSSISMGTNVIAGSKAFYIQSIDRENKHIYLRTSGDVPTSPATQGSSDLDSTFSATSEYEIGDEFSVANGTHYGFCGTITAINGNRITYDYYVMTGIWQNSKPKDRRDTSDAFSIIASVKEEEYWKEYLFWVPAKPEIGFSIINPSTGEDYFQGATAFGDNNKSAANAAFVVGTGNIAGGKGADIFGTRNRGAYGNLIAGGDNFSSGLHSMLLGRYNANLANYNVIFNQNNTIKANSGSIDNLICGESNVLEKGKANIIGGFNNSVSGTYVLVGGNDHTIVGDQNIVAGKKHEVTGGSHFNAIFGEINKALNVSKWNLVCGSTNTITQGLYNTVGGYNNVLDTGSDYNAIFGKDHKIKGDYNLVGGLNNDLKTNSYCFVVGNDNVVSHGYCQLLGTRLVTGAGSQLVIGQDNTASAAAFVIGAGSASSKKNIFTVPKTSLLGSDNYYYSKPSISSDAITYGYLQQALLNGEW